MKDLHNAATLLLDAIEIYEGYDPGSESYAIVESQKARIRYCVEQWNKLVPQKSRYQITITHRSNDSGVMTRLLCLVSFTTLGRKDEDARRHLENYVAEVA